MRGIQTLFAALTALITALAIVGIGVVTIGSDADNHDNPANTIKFYSYSAGAGAGGYDVVAYHTAADAILGQPELKTEWGGETWWFVSAENRELFMASPEKYIPAYGGHCAYGVSQGYLVRGEPKAWTVKNGILYLNYNTRIRASWLASADNFLVTSEEKWKTLTATSTENKQ